MPQLLLVKAHGENTYTHTHTHHFPPRMPCRIVFTLKKTNKCKTFDQCAGLRRRSALKVDYLNKRCRGHAENQYIKDLHVPDIIFTRNIQGWYFIHRHPNPRPPPLLWEVFQMDGSIRVWPFANILILILRASFFGWGFEAVVLGRLFQCRWMRKARMCVTAGGSICQSVYKMSQPSPLFHEHFFSLLLLTVHTCTQIYV